MENSVIRIKPYYYVHVLDNNSNVTRTETGPQTFIKQDHEKVLVEPQPMISIPPRHYAVIQNPCVRGDDGIPIKDSHGQIRLSHGDVEIRFEQDPFPLFPGEKLLGSVTPLLVVNPLSALRLRSIRDFKQIVDGKDLLRIAGDEWLFAGPGFYIPHVAVKVVETIEATIVTTNQALRLKARKSCIDSKGVERRAGEEWLVREDGAYLPGVDEEIVGVLEAYILTDKKALHLQAIRTFTDVFGKQRKAGEEWLVTLEDAETHIPDVYEHVVGEVKITTLTGRQYCVILDPCDEQGKPQLGKKELRKGECSFFLRPGERMESGIQDVIVLSEEEALLLRAKEAYNDKDGDGKKVVRRPGDRWMIYGPCDFVPAVEVEIVEKRRTIPLDENEGIYVRDLKTGRVRSVKGETYMLKPNEELWQKDLPAAVEELLGAERDARTDRWGNEDAKFKSPSGKLRVRDKTRVVSFRAPHNASVQVYDFKAKSSRIVFGPELVMLGPDEQFTVLSLSGGKPKQPNQIRTIALLMGPDFMTDIIVVETSDHTRLQLQLSYNWEFRVSHEDKNDVIKLFSIPDFVGDACKAIASRVRGAVAGVSFDNFHKYSAKIIRTAVFGVDDHGKVGKEFVFTANNLVITNIDIQSVEPVDQRTREALQKSVQLAIEITTNAQEAMARHEAQRLEQEARGRLDRQKIADEAEAEKARTALLELRALSAAVESTGQATAEAKARAEAAAIEGRAAVEQARMKAEAMKIENNTEVENLRSRNELELVQQKQATELEIAKARDIAAIESTKVKELIDSIGSDTIRAIAVAGPEMQVKLLQGLGLTGFLVTDGKNPINLFQTAAGLIGAPSTSS